MFSLFNLVAALAIGLAAGFILGEHIARRRFKRTAQPLVQRMVDDEMRARALRVIDEARAWRDSRRQKP